MEGRAQRMGITKIAAMYGISPRTLRFYEEEGILSSHRKDDSRYREYDKAQRERLEVILLLRRLSFSVREIAGLLHGGEAGFHALLKKKMAVSDRQLLEAKEVNNLLKDLSLSLAAKPVSELRVDELLNRYIYLTNKTERMVRMEAEQEAMYMIAVNLHLIPMVGTDTQPDNLMGKIGLLREELSEGAKTLPLVRIIDDKLLKPYEAALYYDGQELWRDARPGDESPYQRFADEIIAQLKKDALNRL